LGGLKRLTVGIEAQTSWSYALNANLFARCGDADNALKCLSLISKSTVGENLFTMHNDWRDMGVTLQMPIAPFQIDANMGWTATVQEMLVFSDKDRLDLFPALPKQWRKGSIGSLNTRCGVNVKLKWDLNENIAEAELTAVFDTAFDLYMFGRKTSITLNKGDKYVGKIVMEY
jgi:hypothetical protein